MATPSDTEDEQENGAVTQTLETVSKRTLPARGERDRVSESRPPRLGGLLPYWGLVSVLLLRPILGRTQDAPTSRQKLQTRTLRLEAVEHAVAV